MERGGKAIGIWAVNSVYFFIAVLIWRLQFYFGYQEFLAGCSTVYFVSVGKKGFV